MNYYQHPWSLHTLGFASDCSSNRCGRKTGSGGAISERKGLEAKADGTQPNPNKMLRRTQSPLRQASRVWVQNSAGMGRSSWLLPLPLLLLLLFLQPWAGTEAPKDLIGAVWGSITFPLDIPSGQPVESIAWTSNGAVATVIPGGRGNPPNIIITSQRHRGRLTISTDYSLTMSPLSLEDTGTYRADVNTADNTTSTQFSLRVYELLVEPSVMVKSTVSINGSCTVTLTCSVAKGGDNVTFSWTPLGLETTVSPDGAILSISRNPGDPLRGYMCTATNPVSGNSRTVPSDQILCADPVPEWARLVAPLSPMMWMLGAKGLLLLILLGVLVTIFTLGSPHCELQRNPRAGAGRQRAGCPFPSCSPV
ncbi:LOW QUALITY PROTEIN: SLAM family member 9-like [Tachyglossus aculeatus]|uniref:LOW QUALITY PROTEIN: SLAM family member 9-like n=1 Tax=Tachyglossus aculeatus TaxID=9261 RepID=UPI0018F5884A|nr:LOW QUALITY PROTEIN: SLAM family member 9-like [Tachyglossus aculeatus]